MDMNNQKISQSLFELSDAIEQLVMIIAKQNSQNKDSNIAQFELTSKQAFLVVPTSQIHEERAIKDSCGMRTLRAVHLEKQLEKIFFSKK